MKRKALLLTALTRSESMDSKFIDLLKQDVAKREEAASAVNELLPRMPETDRTQWSGRAAQYERNAKAMRELVEQITENVA
jgi:hypothetical protein